MYAFVLIGTSMQFVLCVDYAAGRTNKADTMRAQFRAQIEKNKWVKDPEEITKLLNRYITSSFYVTFRSGAEFIMHYLTYSKVAYAGFVSCGLTSGSENRTHRPPLRISQQGQIGAPQSK